MAMQINIIRRREDGGAEIEAPRVQVDKPMPIVIEEGNVQAQVRARRQGRPVSTVYSTNYPISGGWGYTREDACVIEIKGGVDKRDIPPWERDLHGIEALFVERRVYEEIISHPAASTPDLHNLRWVEKRQRLHSCDDGRKFDELVFEVSGFLAEDYLMLRKDWEAHDGYEHDEAGRRRHLVLAASKRISYLATYWFDITSFMGLS